MVDTIYQYQFVSRVMGELGSTDREDISELLQWVGGGWMLETHVARPIEYKKYTYVAA